MARSLTPDQAKEKSDCLAAIKNHLTENGPGNWNVVHLRFPGVRKNKFFRWVEEFQSGKHDNDYMERSAKVAKSLSKTLPSAAPPTFVAKVGPPVARKTIRILDVVAAIYRDAEQMRMRAAAVDKVTKQILYNEDGDPILGGNTRLWRESIHDRLKSIEVLLAVQQQVWDLEKNEQFYRAIIEIVVDEIGPANPDIQMRIMERLKKLNDERGMNIGEP